MRALHDLCVNPCWQAGDLGRPLPDSEHATSVAMPLWRHVVEYEEGDPAFRAKLALGYPRFVIHPHVARLIAVAEESFATPGEKAFVYPSARVAEGAAKFLRDHRGAPSKILPMPQAGLFALTFPAEVADSAKHYWQHFGEIIPSRRAGAALAGKDISIADCGGKQRVKAQISRHVGCAPEDVFLFSSGMAALAGGLAAARRLRPAAKSVQLGFPYVDGLKIQTLSGPGVHFLPSLTDESLAKVQALLAAGEAISAVFCEVVGNPLLQTANIPRLSEILRHHDVPLVVDDTVATFANVDLLPYADMISSSLTKNFSGVGDVMAGSLVLNPKSPLYTPLRSNLVEHFEDLFWQEDAEVLADNAADFGERIARINQSTEALCDALRSHKAVERIHYPKYETADSYASIKRENGGYGGLFSLVLKDGAQRAPGYFDQLRVSKGPSLGTNYTLACPYTLLAHFQELDWAESLGISRWLIRVSIGLEEVDDLLERFLKHL